VPTRSQPWQVVVSPSQTPHTSYSFRYGAESPANTTGESAPSVSICTSALAAWGAPASSSSDEGPNSCILLHHGQ
jgi:hypothetical protein